MKLVFKETPIFTKLITELLSDDEYKALQLHLVENPESGDIIKGTGGIRKIRWARSDSGKSGGLRIIYYWITEGNQIFMLLAYPKGTQETLTVKQKNLLRKAVQRELQESNNG